jgi:Ras-related GTP-binding protein C/D
MVIVKLYSWTCFALFLFLSILIFYSVTDESETSAFDSQSSSVIRLNNSTIIFMKEVSNVLAMICIWREENFGKSGNF